MKLIGPFKQIVTMSNLSLKGKINDEQLEVINDGGVVVEGEKIVFVDNFNQLKKENSSIEIEEIKSEQVLLPGFIDTHTHICFGGSRAKDFAMRLNGKTYLEIAENGGGIWSTVMQTRNKTKEELIASTKYNLAKLVEKGNTTVEVKSGYALNVKDEIKILEAINEVKNEVDIDIFPTFLGAHMKPNDFEGSNKEYLDTLIEEVFPVLKEKKLSNRVDIFIEQSAFSIEEGRYYLEKAKENGFELTIHADQFSIGGSQLAVEFAVLSADHLEASGEEEIRLLANSDVVATILPGASIGLGMQYAPARKLLDAGACVSIASDWNPGSAPMGDLLTQASILATFEKLSMAEVLAAITFRAAKALGLTDRGCIEKGKLADFVSFPITDFREIIYQQGQIQPIHVWKKGKRIK